MRLATEPEVPEPEAEANSQDRMLAKICQGIRDTKGELGAGEALGRGLPKRPGSLLLTRGERHPPPKTARRAVVASQGR